MKSTKVLLVFGFLLACIATANAGVVPVDKTDFSSNAIVITFDDLSVATQVDDEYESLGVYFVNDEITTPLIVGPYNRNYSQTCSEPNSLANDADYPHTSANVPLKIIFKDPVRKVGMCIGNGENLQPTAVLTAYDVNGNPIGSVSKTVPEPCTEFIGLKSDVPIYSVTLDYGDSYLSEEIDNLMFEK